MLKQTKTIKVSVVLPVYNSAKYLKEALDSLVNQTLQDIEIICIYDRSEDSSLSILNEYAQKDSRVKIIINEEKKGLSYALNKGLEVSCGEYIARMDVDDISDLNRLKIQTEFLDRNSNIGACGTWIKKFGAVNRIVKQPTSDEEIRTKMLFNCCIMHPTVMIRRELLLKHNLKYDETYAVCEDYDFWIRCLKHFDIANLPKVLLMYREHNKNISKKQIDEVLEKTNFLIKKQFQDNGMNISDVIFNIIFGQELYDFNFLNKAHKNILEEATKLKILNRNLFKKYLNKIIFKKLKQRFKETKALRCILEMYRYDKTMAFLFNLGNFYRIRRLY